MNYSELCIFRSGFNTLSCILPSRHIGLLDKTLSWFCVVYYSQGSSFIRRHKRTFAILKYFILDVLYNLKFKKCDMKSFLHIYNNSYQIKLNMNIVSNSIILFYLIGYKANWVFFKLKFALEKSIVYWNAGCGSINFIWKLLDLEVIYTIFRVLTSIFYFKIYSGTQIFTTF